jgi:alkylated DNA repair dioxygenase AlkB
MRFRPKRNTGFFLPTKNDRGKPGYKEVLEVTMKHGDMMVMLGTDIQKFYEVCRINPRARKLSISNRSSTLSNLTECGASL